MESTEAIEQHETYIAEKESLSGRIGMLQIQDYCLRLKHDRLLERVLLQLLTDVNHRVAANAAWILTHLKDEECQKLAPHFHLLANTAIQTDDETLQRLLLTLVYRLPFPEPLPVALLNFCMEKMLSCKSTYSVRCLCMKIAFELSLPVPEICEEFRISLEIMEADFLPPSMQASRKNVLSALRKGKSLRKPAGR